jgi:DNA-binding NtrC family response regulator
MSKRKAVLVVDDSDSVRSVVAAALRAVGYRVHEASTSMEALSILASEDIAFAVSDLSLGGKISGAAVLEEAVRLHPGLQCVLMSGSIAPGEKLRTSFPVLSKPFPPKVLVDLLGSLKEEPE